MSVLGLVYWPIVPIVSDLIIQLLVVFRDFHFPFLPVRSWSCGDFGQYGKSEAVVQLDSLKDSRMHSGRFRHSPLHVFLSPTQYHMNSTRFRIFFSMHFHRKWSVRASGIFFTGTNSISSIDCSWFWRSLENSLSFMHGNRKLMYKYQCFLSQVLVSHTCNPSYSGGRDQEDLGLKPAWRPYLSQKTNHKKGLVQWLKQGVGPEIKPQYWKKMYFKV
jgi:hypothetical protein